MGILDRLFGHGRRPDSGDAGSLSDEQALQRYRYLVKTAPPEAVEEAHREAFGRLTPEQREKVLRELNAATPVNERIADPARNDPGTLARLATRAEIRQPGTVERTLGAPGMGGMFASSLLGSIVGSVIGTSIAHQFLGGFRPGETDAVRDEVAASDTADDETDADASETDTGDVGDDFGSGLGDDL
jgi:hypothetical protein